MGQVSEPYRQGRELGFTIEGLPGEELDEPSQEPEVAATDDAGDAGPTRHADVVIELGEWSDIERGALSDRLRAEGIPHWWVESTLHVADADQEQVEALLGTVEEEERDELDPDREKVAYDMSEWDDARLTTLLSVLEKAEIPVAWDGVELFVHAEDEEAVDQIVERITHPFELPVEEDDDGDEGAELLGDMFVAADRLQHDANDRGAASTVLDLQPRVDAAAAPYGLPPKDWGHLQDRVTVLAGLLQASLREEEAILEAARDLRVSLRPYV